MRDLVRSMLREICRYSNDFGAREEFPLLNFLSVLYEWLNFN